MDGHERRFGIGIIKTVELERDYHLNSCAECGQTEDYEEEFCNGCVSCKSCCECNSCSCVVCEERRSGLSYAGMWSR